MNKKILVVCGNGIASSSIMVSVLEDYLKEQGISGVDVQKSSHLLWIVMLINIIAMI